MPAGISLAAGEYHTFVYLALGENTKVYHKSTQWIYITEKTSSKDEAFSGTPWGNRTLN